ncbi:TMEM175 family protein [Sebaldella sp. S0638]|uniref:TMEM175 family protein n=1 Tax=Sebaldella sp. S0638 TaxID=2957809 RepID=UPI0020A219F1|nr:TMEM175 family protein [Sebaldella sp. S0638]MCP1226180.1 TMEM175 family protein [Sebaldella sp. S0638]
MFGKSRVEAFSDGVLAIVITIMVLELKAPHKADISELAELFPKFFSYVLSFIYVAIYWNNHHHMFSTVERINGKILWANTHLLFWLSLIPFATSWMGETKFSNISAVLYGFVLLMCSIAYHIVQSSIIHLQGENSKLKKAVGKDKKGMISPLLYILGIIFGIFAPVISLVIYTGVAILWTIPDKRIEKMNFLE